MNSKRFDELKSTRLLPSPTGVGMEILRLSRNDCTSIEEIARTLQADPALTGRTLKYANSGNASSSRAITSVRDAIVRIGVRAVMGITLGFSVVCNNRNGACRGFDYSRFWSHSLATALGAQALARRSEGISPDDAFLAGLLCRVGRLALASIHPEQYSEVLAMSAGHSISEIRRFEQQLFATDHAELTGAMLNDWGLPEFLSTAAIHCENPDYGNVAGDAKERQLVAVLNAATLLADICVVDSDGQAAVLVPEFLRRTELLTINSDDVIDLVEETISLWQDWGRILNVNTWPVLSFAELLAKSWEYENQPKPQPVISAQKTVLDGTTDDVLIPPQIVDHTPRKGLRVLLVDDDPAMLRVLTKLLSASGHDVQIACDGETGLRLAMETCPQLVITDWVMPVVDGLDLCRSLRSTEFGRQMYIILLTGLSDEKQLVEAFEAGVDDYVVKPFQAKPLFSRIRAALRVIRLQDELRRDKQQIEQISADLAIANRRLEMDALTDVLTGLPNRRYLMERLSHDWAGARRSGQPLACMVLDIDYFKQVNDSHGHDVGDQVLERVAMILKQSVRTTDVVCRLGGEEFIVVATDSDLESTIRSAERLRHEVETKGRLPFPQLQSPLTVSIGVAVRNEQTRTPESLLKAADEAMYRAKQTGRNRVCSARSLVAEERELPQLGVDARSSPSPTGVQA